MVPWLFWLIKPVRGLPSGTGWSPSAVMRGYSLLACGFRCGSSLRFGHHALSLLPLRANELGAELALGRMLVMHTAQQPDPTHGRLSATCDRIHVVVLQGLA